MKKLLEHEINYDEDKERDDESDNDKVEQGFNNKVNTNRVFIYSEQQKNPDDFNSILKNWIDKKLENRNSSILQEPTFTDNLIIPRLNKSEYNFSLLIGPQALDFALSSATHRKVFSQILFLAKSVCFHSLQPDQKVSITKFLKNNFSFKPTILAIGDTGIGMLDEASIGVSIENSKKQINFAPEIKISKFSDLIDLILVRGHYSYIRFSKVLLFTIYKETMVCTIVFLYQYSCNFSGTSIIDLDLLILFDFFISLIPIVIIGLFEQDASEDDIIASKTLYSTGFFNLELSSTKVAYYYVVGFIQGVIIFVLLEYGYSEVESSSGFTENSDTKGVLGFILISLSIIQKVLLRTNKINLPTILSPFISFGFMILIFELIYENEITQYSLSRNIVFGQFSF